MTLYLILFEGYINNRQGVVYIPNYGGSDPGEDPIGNPIPIGDGWIFMLLLTLWHAVWEAVKSKSL